MEFKRKYYIVVAVIFLLIGWVWWLTIKDGQRLLSPTSVPAHQQEVVYADDSSNTEFNGKK